MMKQQSPEFLLGYLFSEIERKVIKDITGRGPIYGHCPPNTFVTQVPLLWFGVKNANSKFTHPLVLENTLLVAEDLCQKLDKTLQDVFTKRLFHTVVIKDKQYYKFVTTMIEDRRRMTLSQIEDALGYKVTIVSEENTVPKNLKDVTQEVVKDFLFSC